MTDTLIDQQVIEQTGFRPKGRYRRIECDWIEADEGSPKLWAEIRNDIPLGVIHDIPSYGDGLLYRDMWAILAPYVRDWNCIALDINTGEWKPVPPPAEAGPDAFKWVDPLITDWLFVQLKTTYMTVISDPKALTPSEPLPSPPSDTVSDSSGRAKKSPKNRAVSA